MARRNVVDYILNSSSISKHNFYFGENTLFSLIYFFKAKNLINLSVNLSYPCIVRLIKRTENSNLEIKYLYIFYLCRVFQLVRK